MLVFALTISGVLLIAVNVSVWRSGYALGASVAWGIACTVVPCFIMLVLPPVFWHAVALVGASLLWTKCRWSRAAFLPLSLVATLIPYGVLIWSLYHENRRLRDLFPHESMEARVPAPRPDFRPPALSDSALKRLNLVEARVDEKDRENLHPWRNHSLMAIHEDTLHTFVNSPGFG